MPRAYDYLIVGAGSAGAVIASRLSEDRSVSVLLIEAGQRSRHLALRIPLAFVFAHRQRRFSWRYLSEPEPGLGGRTLDIFRGRVVGGSSAVNGLIYARGHRLDYDLWHKAGLQGWSYEDVLPYFRRLETSWRGESRYHGANGPIAVTQVNSPIMRYESVRDAVLDAGYPETDDLYGDQPEGVTRLEMTVRRGERSGVAGAYLDPASRRSNLTIMTTATVHRVLVERGRAVGVELTRHSRKETIYANAEVVLSAGALNSPQLLMLSGIGCATELQRLGIKPVHNLPGVGRNLSEHPIVPVMWRARTTNTFLKYLRLDRAAAALFQWLWAKRGPFTTNACYANICIASRAGLARPDLQIVATALGLDARPWFPVVTASPVHRYVAIVGILHPNSRGAVSLRSDNPGDSPRVLYNLYQDPGDLRGMISGIRIAREIYAQKPQRRWMGEELTPGASFNTDHALGRYVRDNTALGQHPVGTCAMGYGPEAVVDASLRIHGISGLRVCDASVMPEVPGGNTNVPVIMIGERASDLLRNKAPPSTTGALSASM